MTNVQTLTEYLLANGKTHSWRELAEKFEIYSDLPVNRKTNKKKADFVRRLYDKLQPPPGVSDLLEEFKSFVKSKNITSGIEPYVGNPNNIIVLGDTHIPYNHPEYFEFARHIQRKWNCGKVIHIGDVLDFHATTYHQPHPDALSPYYEMELAKLEIEKWKAAFPEMVVTTGNHDRRVSRKMYDSQISSQWQKSIADVLEVNWQFVNDYVYNDIYFCHGEGVTARVTALQKQMSAVQGHRHSESYIDFPAKGLFAVQTPIGVNRNSLAFNYGRMDPREWLIGVTVILDSKTPVIERL